MACGDVGNEGMEDLIKLVNRLQDAFSASGLPFGLELPQIVVVGGQSAGKSSVLENFVGKDFLPRGAGIVTRRPLVLQLIFSQTEYAEFLHCPNQRFTDFAKVRQEIEDETDRETGSNKGISHKPINLKVYSPNVLDLTLVDLPGMTRVAVGDQPQDIEIQIRNMVLEFVKRQNSLILAVSPANSDLANSDAMRIAKEVDPTGHRTIGVITKLDLMDEGTDARDILLNKLLPLKRGYIGVVNRSQKDIDGQKDIRAAMERERQFFVGHVGYREMADRMGTPYLQQVLNRELSRHIQETIPSIRNTLRTKMLEIKKEMGSMEDTSTPAKVRALLLKILQEFSEEVETQIQGLNADIDTRGLAGGAQINRLFYNEFADNLSLEQIPANMLRKEVAFAIRNIHGVRNGIFTPDMAFHATVVKIIARFKEPLMQCVVEVGDVLRAIVERAADKVIKTAPNLKEEVVFLIKSHLQEQEEKAKMQLAMHVDAETSFMNTRHEDFIGRPGETHTGDTPEFTQSLGSVKRKIEITAKVIQKGWLTLKGKGRFGSHDYWFVLTTDSLTSFTKDSEQEVVFSLHLNAKVKQRFEEKKAKVTLYNIDGKPIFMDTKVIELTCEDEQDGNLWSNCFKTAGVHPEDPSGPTSPKDKKGKDATKADEDVGKGGVIRRKEAIEEEDTSSVQRRPNSNLVRRNRETLRDFTKSMMEPDMDKQIEVIKMMVESYLKIVGKTIRDIAPKYIMLLVVINTQKFVSSDLMSTILIENNPMTLMQGDSEQENRREQLHKMYKTAEDALRIIGEAVL